MGAEWRQTWTPAHMSHCSCIPPGLHQNCPLHQCHPQKTHSPQGDSASSASSALTACAPIEKMGWAREIAFAQCTVVTHLERRRPMEVLREKSGLGLWEGHTGKRSSLSFKLTNQLGGMHPNRFLYTAIEAQRHEISGGQNVVDKVTIEHALLTHKEISWVWVIKRRWV